MNRPWDHMPKETLEKRIERALVILAYVIELDGDVHIPLYESLEADLVEIRRKASVRQRAMDRLKAARANAPPLASPFQVEGLAEPSPASRASKCRTPSTRTRRPSATGNPV